MSAPRYRLALFASGNGSNAEAIMRYFASHESVRVSLVLTNNKNAFVLERARQRGVDTRVFDRDMFQSGTLILDWLKEKEITHIALAGFLWLIPNYLIEQYPDRIVNIHPALLPKFGGKGMYGMKVHEAVLAANEKETGITIHLVNAHYDEGRVLFQERCNVDNNCTAEGIAKKVLELEHRTYPAVIERWLLSGDSYENKH